MMEQAELDEVVTHLRARGTDSVSVEVKAARDGCPKLLETLCAFANMPEGGVLILGLDEAEGFAPVGLQDIGALEQGVTSQAREGVSPPPSLTFETRVVDGEQVLVVLVSGLPLHDRPARTARGAFLRQGDGDYLMSSQELSYIDLQKAQTLQRVEADRLPVEGALQTDLDGELTAAFVAAYRRQSRRLHEASEADVLRWSGVVDEHAVPTLAGAYALGRHPQAWSPMLGITAAVNLPRSAGVRTRDLVHLNGPIPDLLDEAMAWVVRNTRTTMGYDPRGHGRDFTELPMRAVREIIANALVHRDLSTLTRNKPVEIRMLDDKLVITSPGGLWGVSERQLGRPEGKSAVNPTLYALCRQVRMPDGSRVIEGEGGGIAEAMAALREAGLRPMVFVDRGVNFTVIISRHTLLTDDDMAWLATVPSSERLTSEQRAVLASMRAGQAWTNAMVREHFPPMDTMAARRLLRDLVDQGLACQEGERGGTTYVLADYVTGRRDPEPTLFEPEVPRDIAALTTHAAAVWRALAIPRSRRELQADLGLTARQVHHALEKMRAAGVVDPIGRLTDPAVTYQRRQR